jgi:hypothetical protein
LPAPPLRTSKTTYEYLSSCAATTAALICLTRGVHLRYAIQNHRPPFRHSTSSLRRTRLSAPDCIASAASKACLQAMPTHDIVGHYDGGCVIRLRRVLRRCRRKRRRLCRRLRDRRAVLVRHASMHMLHHGRREAARCSPGRQWPARQNDMPGTPEQAVHQSKLTHVPTDSFDRTCRDPRHAIREGHVWGVWRT